MPLAKIKEEYKTRVVAFGKSAAPLFKRDDIDDLAILAIESGDKLLISYFEQLPPLDVLKKAKTDKDLGRGPVISEAPKEQPKPVQKKK